MISVMKKIAGTIIGISSFLSFALPAFAAEVKTCPAAPFDALCNFNFDKFGNVISNAIVLFLIVAIIIAVFFLIYGGIKWIISGGDKTGVESARNHIIAAIVGLVIALLAFFILSVVLKLFGITNPTTFTLPVLAP